MPRARKWGSFQVSMALLETFDSARTEIDELAEEMHSWEENIADSFGNTQKYEEVSECADYLESAKSTLNGISLEDDLEKVEALGLKIPEVKFMEYRKRGGPRWVRCSNAMAQLEAVAEALKSIKPDTETEEENERLEEELEKIGLDETIDNIEEAKSELEGCGFPGMF